jgi:hypothetical protein
MQLGAQDLNLKTVVFTIIKKGCQTLLDSLKVEQINNYNTQNVRRCPVCQRILGPQTLMAYQISDSSGFRIFNDVFDCPECCHLCICWIKYLYSYFQWMLDPCAIRTLTIKDITDSSVHYSLLRLQYKHKINVLGLGKFSRINFNKIRIEEIEFTEVQS